VAAAVGVQGAQQQAMQAVEQERGGLLWSSTANPPASVPRVTKRTSARRVRKLWHGV
jgi:hypothetical protein